MPMLERILTLLVQLLVIAVVAWIVFILGNHIFAILEVPSQLFVLWEAIVLIAALIGVIKVTRPFWP